MGSNQRSTDGLNKLVVISMRADPEPDNRTVIVQSEGSVVRADADGPELSYLLEVERWVMRIGLE